MRTPAAARLALLSLLPLLWAAAAGADPREAHRLGLEALEAGRWSDAERAFAEAIGERGEERVQPLLGRRYLPHYYLGVARAEQGKCRAALRAFAESRRQARIERVRELAEDLERRRAACRRLLERIDAARTETEEVLAQAEDAAETLERLSRDPVLAPRWSQGSLSFGVRQRELLDSLRRTRGLLERGYERSDLGALGEAESQARQALEGLQALIVGARRETRTLSDAIADALGRLVSTQAAAVKLIGSLAELEPHPPVLARRLADVERLLETVRRSEENAPPGELEVLADQLETAVAALRRAAARPPANLAAAAEAFLRGDYRAVLSELDGDRSRDRRVRLLACVLRAAALHALFRLDGEHNAALYADGLAEASRCAELDPAFEPAESQFSPAFVAFYRAAAGRGAAAEEETETNAGNGE